MVKQLFSQLTFAFISVILLALPAHALTKVTATIDKNPVEVNESFILTVTADDRLSNNAFDSSPLLADFIVGNTSTRSQQSIYNGVSQLSTTWSTLLIAREKGQKIIPALSVNNVKTNPIALVVVEKNSSNPASQKEIFITTDISNKEVYVQELLTLTVKLHFSVELQRGSLSDPKLESANISQIGKDKETDETINGKRYRVIERTYAISPQQSGKFTLGSPQFTGEVTVPSRRRNSFMSFSESKPVSIMGDSININVDPIPVEYQGDWLPSELVILNQEWQPEIAKFTVGEPITRVITLTAAGLAEEQLPELTINMPDGLKVYPDQVELHSGINHERIVSQKIQKFALVASKAGEYELPEIRIPWWNTVTNKKEIAIIPAQSVTVLPNPDAPKLNNQNQDNSLNKKTANENSSTPESKGMESDNGSVLFSPIFWLLICTSLLSSFGCFYFWYQNRVLSALLNQTGRPVDSTAIGTTKKQGSFQSNSKVQKYDVLNIYQACKDGAGEQVLSLLPKWAMLYMSNTHKNPMSIEEITTTIDDNEFSHLVNELQNSCFSKEQKSWQGKPLNNALKRIEQTLKRSPSNKTKKQDILLNP